MTSGCGYLEADDPEFRKILDAMDRLHAEFPDLKICVSLGILSEETAKALAEHGAYRYNMNLQTNPERYAELVSDTHTIEEKIRLLQQQKQDLADSLITGDQAMTKRLTEEDIKYIFGN